MTEKTGSNRLRIVRRIARACSGFTAAFILFIFIGDGLADGFESIIHLSVRETAMMAAFIFVWLGLLLGWKWELYGGLLTVGGMAAFYLLNYVFSGTFPRGPFFLLFASPGLLFIYYGLQTRKNVGTDFED